MAGERDEVDAALRDVHDKRGYTSDVHRYMAETDLEFFNIYNSLVDYTLYDSDADEPGRLPAKYREIILSVILAFRAGHFVTPNNVLVMHIGRALRLGATRQEIFDAFQAAILSGGAPTFLAGIMALREAEKAVGSTPTEPPADHKD